MLPCKVTSTLRSDSRHKWYILVFVSTLWIASYHCILCIASLEGNLLGMFHLSQTEYALLSTVCFVFAMLASLLTPYLIQRLNLYNSMLFACILVTAGQSVFMLGTAIPIHSSNILIMYAGRILLGFGYGIQNVTIYCTVNVWFKYNIWLSFALNTVNSTYTIGVLTSRFALVPIYQSSKLLFLSFFVGVVLAFISVLSCICMSFVEKHFIKQCNVNATCTETNVSMIDLDHDFRKIRRFNFNIWLLMIIIIIGWASCETFGTQITEPFIDAFGISENNVNFLLSIQSFLALTVSQIWGYLSSKYGYLSHILISSMLFMTLGVGLLFVHGLQYDDDGGSTMLAVFHQIPPAVMMAVIVILYAIGLQQFFAVSFTCLSLVCPLELLSIANSVVSVAFMIGSAAESWIFGVIADATHSYQYSLLMMILLTLVGAIFAVIVHVIDVSSNGPLHEMKTETIERHQKYLIVPLAFAYLNGLGCSTNDEKPFSADICNV